VSDIPFWVYLIWCAVGVGVGWLIGTLRGYPLLGAVLGIFTVVGWIIVAMIPARDRTRPPIAEHAVTPRPPDLPHGALPPHPDHGSGNHVGEIE
jgi:membrane associated rhomboid family serine protease